MRKVVCSLVLVAANLTAASFAAEMDLGEGAAEATFSWRLGFGGAGAPQPGYGLAVGYRGAGPDPIGGRLFQVDVDGNRAFARIAGLPLHERNFRAQLDEATSDAPAGEATPWYARQWVWWTAGGLAATMALTGGDGDIEINNTSTTTRNSSGCAGVSGNVGDTDMGCVGAEGGGSVVSENDEGQLCAAEGWGDEVPEECVSRPGEGFVAREARGWIDSRAYSAWLDAGTGHMGDLAAR